MCDKREVRDAVPRPPADSACNRQRAWSSAHFHLRWNKHGRYKITSQTSSALRRNGRGIMSNRRNKVKSTRPVQWRMRPERPVAKHAAGCPNACRRGPLKISSNLRRAIRVAPSGRKRKLGYHYAFAIGGMNCRYVIVDERYVTFFVAFSLISFAGDSRTRRRSLLSMCSTADYPMWHRRVSNRRDGTI